MAIHYCAICIIYIRSMKYETWIIDDRSIMFHELELIPD